jgi:hypothetical protein
MSVLLRSNKTGRVLYAVAYFIYSKENKEIVKTGFEYMHADNAAHARACFFAAHPKAAKMHNLGRLEITGIAPAIGMKTDDNGENGIITG